MLMLALGQQAGQLGQHARLVGHAQTQVIAGPHFSHRQDVQIAHGPRLESQVGHTVERVRSVQTGDVHQVGDHRAGSRLGACAFAVVQSRAHSIALHHHGIHRAFDVGDQTLGRDQAGVHTQLNALCGALGDAEQLDAVTQLLGVLDVGRAQLGDAFDISLVKLHRNAKRDRAHQGHFVRSVHALDVKGRIGFGIT